MYNISNSCFLWGHHLHYTIAQYNSLYIQQAVAAMSLCQTGMTKCSETCL